MRSGKAWGTNALLFSAAIGSVLFSAPAFAEVRVFEADGVYALGDHASRTDGRRIAAREAQCRALEQAGVFAESLAEVRSLLLGPEEVRAYAAGVAVTETLSDEMHGTVQNPEARVKIRCALDSEALKARVLQYRENDDMKEQLIAFSRESEELKSEREALVSRLGAERNAAKAGKTRAKLDAVLTAEETNDETLRIWMKLAHQLDDDNGEAGPAPAELDEPAASLQRIIGSNPHNARARCLLAAIYQRRGDLASAEGELRAAIERNPSNPLPHLRLGLVLREKGKLQEALKEFHFVERLKPAHPLMVYYTGLTLRDRGQCSRAVKYFEKFLKDRQPARFSTKQEEAAAAIQQCGGGSHRRRIRTR